MPKYTVVIEARKIVDVDQTVEVEARNAEEAHDEVVKMIERGLIRNSAFEEVSSSYEDERVADVKKIRGK
jgi:hypothetical protein